eukprot:1147995-Pelagomonas_calceolata.AAC.3
MRRKLEQHNSTNDPRGHDRHVHDMPRTSVLSIHYHRCIVMFFCLAMPTPPTSPMPKKACKYNACPAITLISFSASGVHAICIQASKNRGVWGRRGFLEAPPSEPGCEKRKEKLCGHWKTLSTSMKAKSLFRAEDCISPPPREEKSKRSMGIRRVTNSA